MLGNRKYKKIQWADFVPVKIPPSWSEKEEDLLRIVCFKFGVRNGVKENFLHAHILEKASRQKYPFYFNVFLRIPPQNEPQRLSLVPTLRIGFIFEVTCDYKYPKNILVSMRHWRCRLPIRSSRTYFVHLDKKKLEAPSGFYFLFNPFLCTTTSGILNEEVK